jgi:hypothetical protein
MKPFLAIAPKSPSLPAATGLRMTKRARAVGVDVLLAGAVLVVVAAPMLFTDSGFGLDFTNHLWLAWAAGKALVAAGHPSYFLNTTQLGVFYPMFAFYGGTLYTTTGAISEVLGGHPVLAYVGVTMLAIAGCYGGTLWFGRQLGLHGWLAHAPAAAVVTSAYYITDLYGRGAWPELVAVSTIAPLIASGLHLVRARRWRVCPVLIFVVSGVFFTGSHNITLAWGTILIALALLVLWLVLGASRRLPYRRLAMVAGLGMASLLVNAWFLFPDIAYQGDVVAHYVSTFRWEGTSFFNTPAVVFDPLRAVPRQSTTPALFVQAPDWFLAWALLAGALLLCRRRGYGLRRAWIGAAILVALVLGMIMLEPFWSLVPAPLTDIQFPYRLDSYLFYAVAGLVLVVALAIQRAAHERPRSIVKGLRLSLCAVVAISFGLCIWQEWAPNTLFAKSYTKRGEALASPNVLPRSWYDGGSYRDVRAPLVTVPIGRSLVIDPRQVHGDRFAAWMNVPPGPEPIQTNIEGGDYLVQISGLEWLGRNLEGEAVVRRIGGGSGPVHVVVETKHSFIIELGRVLSILAILTILTVIAHTWARGRRSRRTEASKGPRPNPSGVLRRDRFRRRPLPPTQTAP